MPDAITPAPPFLASEDVNGRLAYDLACQLYPVGTILKQYGLTEPQLVNLLKNEQFANMVKETRAKFLSGLSTPERVQLKAQIALEGCIAPMYGIVHDPQTAVGAKTDATKILTTIAGLSKGDALPQQAQKFVLNISLGDKSIGITAEPPTIEQKAS